MNQIVLMRKKKRMTKKELIRRNYIRHVQYCVKCQQNKICDAKKALLKEIHKLGEKEPQSMFISY